MKSLCCEIEGSGLVERLSPEVWLDRIKRLDVLRDMVAKNVKQAGDKQERLYNRNKWYVEYNVGDEVMKRVHVLSNASKRFNAKLDPKYEGPFTIVEKKSPTVYILDSKERGSKRLAMMHVSELKRYVPPRKVNEKNDARLSVTGTTKRVNNEVEPAHGRTADVQRVEGYGRNERADLYIRFAAYVLGEVSYERAEEKVERVTKIENETKTEMMARRRILRL